MRYENMMDIDRLKEKKKALGYTNEDVARLSGVPLGTVQKAFGNVTAQPRRKTMIALAKVLDPQMANRLQSGCAVIDKRSGVSDAGVVRESQAAYSAISHERGDSRPEDYQKELPDKKQGEYTLKDYYSIPDDRRVELIDGVIYDMTAPSSNHQLVAGEVFHQLMLCKKEHNIDCMPFISPIDVQLNRDEKTMVQPDVIIVCNKNMIINRCIYGAPDFVLEVLSKSTRRKDQIVKLKKYIEAGCKEYWIVDIDNRTVTVYDFSDEYWPKVYSFTDKIPVAVSKGYCEIDFAAVDDLLKEYGVFDERSV